MVINGKTKCIYLLDELLEIKDFGLYSVGIVEMVTREITKKSYRETAKTISEDTDNTISHTAVRNIVLKIGEKIKELEEEKIKLYEEGKIEGEKEAQYIFCEHDGIYIKKQKSKKHKGKKKIKIKHFKKKKRKKKKNGIELKIAVIHEGKEPRYTNDYKLKNKIIVGTASKAKELKKIEDATIGTTYKEHTIKNVIINGDGADWTGNIVEGAKEIFQLDMAHIQKKIYMAVSDEEYLKKMQQVVYTEQAEEIFNVIYNYKVELEADKKIEELEKVKELDSEESEMYCTCRDRMKKNRTSWCVEGAEALLKVIMNKMNGTLEEIITKKAEKKIKEELAERIQEPKKVRKTKIASIQYAGRYEIANNFTGSTKKYIIDLLRDKKCSELMLIN